VELTVLAQSIQVFTAQCKYVLITVMVPWHTTRNFGQSRVNDLLKISTDPLALSNIVSEHDQRTAGRWHMANERTEQQTKVLNWKCKECIRHQTN